MTELAICGEPGFEISLADAPRAGKPNYSLDTLSGLRIEMAGAQLFFLMGADSFLGLKHWHRAAEIPFAAHLIVASRPGEPLVNVAAALPEGLSLEASPEVESPSGKALVESYQLRNCSGVAAPFYLLPGLHVDISATRIREQIQCNDNRSKEISDSVPEAVVGYIRSHGLYRSLAPTSTRD
jgi:nicotinate-nucleotide adenylyltransferase